MPDDACQRARRALTELCGTDTEPDDTNTIWTEAVFSQGRQTTPDDFLEVETFVEGVVLEEFATGPRSPQIVEQNIFAVGGEDRPEAPTRPMTGSGTGRIHVFIKFDNKTLGVGQLGAMKNALRRRFDQSDAGIGRGFDGLNVVDDHIVSRAAPERAGPNRVLL